MAAISKDFVVKNGIVIEGDSVVTSSTNQIDALQVDGGAAIAKNLIVGTTATIFGNVFLNQPILPLSRAATLGSPDTPFSELYLSGNSLYLGNVVVSSTGSEVTFSSSVGSTLLHAGALTLSDITVSNSPTTGALQVAGGAGISGNLYVGSDAKFQQTLSVTGTSAFYSTVAVAGVTSINNATSATIAGDGALKVTGGARINNNLVVMSTASTTGTLETNAIYVEGGVGIKGGLAVSGNTVFKSNVYFQGSTTFVSSTNTVYTDNLIELHMPPAGGWTFDDGKDIGFRFHYYNNSDWNAALVLANDTKKLEFYKNGTEVNGAFVGVYGDFKTGTIQLTNTATSTSTTTGALTVAGGVGIAGTLYVAGRITGTVTQANNLNGGAKGAIPIQGSTGTTTFIAPGTGNAQVLTWDPATSTAIWGTNTGAASADTAYNIAGGGPGAIVYQLTTGSTTFLSGSSAAYMLTYNTDTHAPQWTDPNTYSVGYANTATTSTWASTASYAVYAGSADFATTASLANHALSADFATSATTSTYAFTATYANSSNYAIASSTSSYANTATTSTYAFTATYADIAFTATYANIAFTSSYATTATTSTYAFTSTYADIASTSTYANIAFTATYADTSNYALAAGTSNYATNAGTAVRASTSTNIAGGSIGSVLYQSTAGITVSLPLGNPGDILTADSTAPKWLGLGNLTAGYANTATTATYANTSNYAIVAGTSSYATTATNATYANTSNYAIVAGTSTYANTSNYAIVAGTSTYATTATYANTSTNIVGGAAGSVLYQSGNGATTSLPLGNLGEVLIADAFVPKWVAISGLSAGSATTATTSTYAFTATYANTSNYAIVAGTSTYANTSNYAIVASTSTYANTSTNISGGVAGQLVYQSATGITNFVNTGTLGSILVSNGSNAPTYNNTLTLAGTTSATSTITGAFQVRGGAGIGGDMYVGGAIHAATTSYIGTGTILTTLDLQTITYQATYLTNDPTSVAGLVAVAGTSTAYGTYNFGTVTDIQTFNDYNTATNTGFYSINDATGAPGALTYIGFTGVADFNRFVLNINYTASSGHTQDIDLYNWVTSGWDTFTTYSGSTNWFQFIEGVINPAPYISGGAVWARIYHVSNGNTAHRTWIDYAALEKSVQGGQGPRGPAGATGATGPQGLTTTTPSTFVFSSTVDSTSTTSGSVIVAGGVGIGKSLFVGSSATILSTAASTGSLQANALYVAGGIGAGSLFVQGPSVFNSSVVFNGTSTSVLTTNTIYTDNIIELHYPNNTGSQWLVNDTVDIGFRFHYFDTQDRNGFLGRDNATGYLEWLVNANADSAPNVTGTNGTFRLGSIILTDTTASSSTATGSLTVVGGVGIGGALYVGTSSYIAGAQILTTATVGQFASQTTIFAGTDTAVNTSTGAVTVWNVSTLQSVTNRGSTTTTAISITNPTASGNTSTGALTIAGGVGVAGGVFVGGNVTATTFFGNLTGVASTATNVAGGASGSLPYQSATGTTAMLAIGTNGYVLTSNGSAPTWNAISGLSAGNATTSTNLAGGTAGQVPYQTAPGLTSFYGPGTAGTVLVSNGTSAPAYQSTLTLASTTLSTSTGTGALQVRGGVGVADSVYVGNRIGFVGTTQASVVYQYYNTLTNSLDTVFG